MGRTRTKEPQTEEKLRSAPILVPNTLLPVAACVSLTAGTDDQPKSPRTVRKSYVTKRPSSTAMHIRRNRRQKSTKKMGHTHAAAGQNHDRLLNAISDLEKFL